MINKKWQVRMMLLIIGILMALSLAGCQEASLTQEALPAGEDLSTEEKLANQYFNLVYSVEDNEGLTSQSAILSEAKTRLFELEKMVGSDLKMALLQSETLNDVLQYASLNDYTLRITDVVLEEVNGESGRMLFDYTMNLGVADASGDEKRSSISGVIALERDGERWMVHGDTGLDFPSEWRENRLESVEPKNDGDTLDEP